MSYKQQIKLAPILEELAKYIERFLKEQNVVEIYYAVLIGLSNSYRAYKVMSFLMKNGFPYDVERRRFYFGKDELEKLKKIIDELKRKESIAGVI